jgi:probable phosphoglycerate mutase
VVTTLWLVRHGVTAWNLEGRLLGWADPPLVEEGRRQAEAARARLGALLPEGGQVWSSDLVRAVDTARIVAGEPTTDPRLRELDFGDLEGSTWSELTGPVRSALLGFDGFEAPGGETAAALATRVATFVDELGPGDHVVVTHGGVIRSLVRRLGRPDPHVEPGGILRLQPGGGGLSRSHG